MVWVQFVVCFLLLLLAGQRLAKYSHILSVRTKLGGLWIGLILVATITSVPETVAAVSAASLFHNSDLALATLYGGNTFNLAMVAVMDLLYRRRPLLKMVSRRQLYLLFSCVTLLTVSAIAIAMGPNFSIALGPVGVTSIFLLILYGIMLYLQQKSAQPEEQEGDGYLEYTLRNLAMKLIIASGAVVAGGVWLSYIGDRIAAETALSSSFVGSLFLAVSTSAPELIVSLTAIRIGALELAVANITGSIMYRSAIIFLPDLFQGDGPILSSVSTSNLFIVVAAIVMSLVVIAGLRWPGRHKTFGIMSWYTPLIIGAYLLSFYLLLTV